LRLSAENGDEDAQFAMGEYSKTTKSEHGIIKLRDLTGALAWYTLAERSGSLEAKQAIKRLKPSMTHGQITKAKYELKAIDSKVS
jgi:TPR repeat protein